MKEGDYVRTKHFGINKIKGFYSDVYYDYIMVNDDLIKKEDIIKSSPNIIDLIEVGDIITFKEDDDVYKVICIPDKEVGLDIFYLAKNYDGETEDISISKEQMEKYIKSIVTKEQFESMEYKVGE